MEQRRIKFRPFHAVLIVAMLALTAGLYVFKDRFLPDQNASYRETLSTYIETTATIISFEQATKRRTIVNVQFRDQDDVLTTAKVEDNTLRFVSAGDEITIFYNPENPKQAIHRMPE